ncbi:MAG TPA: hypothetical protein PKE26_01885 [Kiritimatiellia bacterium]|nr:hypothetical protein [Kiritimatiellia bacterium]HMO97839.1 hypothetical protein [Kiritimatiellia bacterium]HMP98013.1 hypothetical protein [Kiritimatiellia bacterium]
MRTTVEIPDEIFRMAKQVSLERDCTFRELLTDALVHELKGRSSSHVARRHELPSVILPADAPILSMIPEALAAEDVKQEVSRHAGFGH